MILIKRFIKYVCSEQFWSIFNENFKPIPVSMSKVTFIGSSIKKKKYGIKTELVCLFLFCFFCFFVFFFASIYWPFAKENFKDGWLSIKPKDT